MTAAREITQPASTDLPTWRILINDQEASSELHLMSILVSKSVNRIARAKLELLDGDVAKEDFKLSNTDHFIPGNDIEILAGYHSDESTIFKGKITGHCLKCRQGRPSKLSIDCRDAAVLMTMGRKSAYFQELSDSDIIEDLLNQYGLDADIESTDVTHKEMVQYNASDWDFLLERAQANGQVVMVDDGKLAVKKPDTSLEPELSLVLGSTILEFEAEMDARHQHQDVSSQAWRFSDQAVVEEEGESPAFTEQGNLSGDTLAESFGQEALLLSHSGYRKDDELKAWADAHLGRGQLAKIIGRVKCQGYGNIKPGQMLELSGVGERFNGKVYVSGISHQLDVNNWETDIQFGLAPDLLAVDNGVADAPAAGLLPPVHGLGIGVVTQLQDDPDGEDRVKVRMPIIDAADEGIWARIASLDAGAERGAFFRPEIDDEVVLGFLNDDPRDPVILGMFNSSAKPAPISATDDNHEKGFVTRSQMKVIFDDDAVSIKIETPNGNTMTLSDEAGSILLEDENSNRIEMNADGISIESPGEINIAAKQDLNMDGLNVNTKADVMLKAEGSAGAELSSSAIATVKGSLVQIN